MIAGVGARGPDSYPAGTWTAADNGYAYVFDLETGAQLARLSPVQGTNASLAAPPATYRQTARGNEASSTSHDRLCPFDAQVHVHPVGAFDAISAISS